MKYSFAIAALAAGASAAYQAEVPSGYPVESVPATSEAVSSSAPVPSYPAKSATESASVPSYPVKSATESAPVPTYPAGEKSTSASSPASSPASYPAGKPSSSVVISSYTTEVVPTYTTFCPEPTTITHGTKTYTVTEPTTLTISDCPCTVSKPVYVTSTVSCTTCSTAVPPPPATYPNVTAPVDTPSTISTVHPTGGYPTKPASGTPSTPIPTAGAAKVAGFSGAVLAAAAALLI